MFKVNKKALEWEILIFWLIAAVVLIWALMYFTGLGEKIKELIADFFSAFYK